MLITFSRTNYRRWTLQRHSVVSTFYSAASCSLPFSLPKSWQVWCFFAWLYLNVEMFDRFSKYFQRHTKFATRWSINDSLRNVVNISMLLNGLTLIYHNIVQRFLITSAEEGGYVFTSVCLSVCLSVRRITEKVVNGFWRNLLEGSRDQGYKFWWLSASLSGSGSAFRITIRIREELPRCQHTQNRCPQCNPPAELCWRSAEVCALLVVLVANLIKLL